MERSAKVTKKPHGIPPEKIIVKGRTPLPPIPEESALRTHCYLCGQITTPLEVEHVVPRVLFRGFDPVEYVKLWSCKECNKAKGLDDEYVVRFLQASSVAPAATKGFESAVRGFMREEHGKGLGRAMFESMERVEITTRSGIILGGNPALKIDHARFKNFFTNLAKGLYVRTSLRIHDWSLFNPRVYFEQGIQSDRLFKDPILKQLRQLSRYGGYWEHIFSYFTDFSEVNSLSCMYFYSTYIAVVYFIHKEPA